MNNPEIKTITTLEPVKMSSDQQFNRNKSKRQRSDTLYQKLPVIYDEQNVKTKNGVIDRTRRDFSSQFIPKNEYPGPGDYTPNHEQIKKRSARSIFGSNIRFANIVPSQQNYCHNTKEVWNDGPKVGFTKKIRSELFQDSKNNFPGPSSYNLNLSFVKNNNAQVKFTKEQRLFEKEGYNTAVFFSKRPIQKFGQSQNQTIYNQYKQAQRARNTQNFSKSNANVIQ